MTNTSNPLLRIEGVSKRFKGENGEDNTILNNIDLTVDKNEFLCLLGRSGCGKTTLLRCIAGFESYEGEIYINDKLETVPNTSRTMVFQDFNQLFPWKTVEKNVQYPLKKKGIKDKAELQRISDEYLALVELDNRKHHYPHQLSGGMKQRVAIARSLAVQPNIILMDEPFASLDAQTRAFLQKELLSIKEKRDMTVIFVTHNIQEALKLGTRVILMGQEQGKIDLDVRPDLTPPITPETEGFSHYWGMFSEGLGRRK
jgi:NitT/TauT family transport system ATP-binding protein